MQIVIQSTGAELCANVVGTGPEVILLHAGGERRSVWSPIANKLAKAGFGAVSLDQRGHGESSGSAEDGIDAFGADLTRVVDHRGGCPLVVGASLGGFAALLALRRNDCQHTSAGLVLIDVVPDPEPETVRRFFDKTPARGSSPLVAEILHRVEDFSQAARSLRLPVLLVLAGRSVVGSEQVERLRIAVPQLQVATVKDAGHLVARDAPEALADVLISFASSDAVRDRRIDAFIQRAGGSELSHPGGSLSKHLHRVGDTLRRWGVDATLVDAGRLHAAYGTQGFALPANEVATKDQLLQTVSAESNRLISLYARCDRRASFATWSTEEPVLVDRSNGTTLALSEGDRISLIALTVANEIDVLNHDAVLATTHGAALSNLFATWRQWLPPAGNKELDDWITGRDHTP